MERTKTENEEMTTRTSRLARFAEYRRIAEIDEIGRRYLAMNAFDGILTMIGVLMGGYIAGIHEARTVLYTAFATCLAMGISGLSGAYMTESAERKHDLQSLETAMLRDLGETEQARAGRFAVIVVSLIDGLSPLIAGMTVVAPFFFASLAGSIQTLYIISLVIALCLLFVLGAFLASVAKENMLRSGVRMVIAGLACVALSLVLNVTE
jgi:predicted membrane protein (TIGR00267 family)